VEKPATEVSPRPPPEQPQDPHPYDQALYDRLRAWRLTTAREIEKPAYVVFHDAVLKRIAACRPTNPQELLAIKGVGPRKLEQFGTAVLDVVKNESQIHKEA
jgi:superfamily II DNA helicase RecQ